MKRSDRVLVTGGSGFIGTHLCRALVQSGYSVRVLDLVSPKEAVPSVEYVAGDILNANAMLRAVAGVGAVFHLAAVVSVPLCQAHPADSFETNVIGTLRVLEAIQGEMARAQAPVRMIFSSSAAVYGAQGKVGVPLSESLPLTESRSFYALQKRSAEEAIRLFWQLHGVPALVFRFFNVYGPGQDPLSPYSGVMTIFASNLRRGLALRLNGGGYQTRDFISVSDVARACVMSLDLPLDSSTGQAINLGSGQARSIRELAEEMGRAIEKSVNVEVCSSLSGDVEHSLADIRKGAEILGWYPEAVLSEGLRRLFSTDS